MATLLERNEFNVPARRAERSDHIPVIESDAALGRNLPQRVARKVWGPALAMGLLGLVTGYGVLASRAGAASPETLARLQHVGLAILFLGFLGVFSAIVFAIARILGELRAGGGSFQEAAGVTVQTLRIPATGRAMLGLMALGMMVLLGGIVGHVVAATSVVGATAADLLRAEQWGATLEAVRRLGVGLYLVSITLGMATILHALRFQTIHVTEVADQVAATRG